MRANAARTTGLLALLATVAVAAPGDAAASHAGPLAAQWHLDQISAANTTPDSSGHGLTGTTDGVEPTPGRFGPGFFFGGTASVGVPATATLEPASVSVSAWVRGTSPGANRAIVAKGGDARCTSPSWGLESGAGGGAEFYVRGAGGQRFATPEAAVNQVWDDTWHAVAGTYDGATMRLYVDGQQVGAASTGPPAIDYALADRGFAMGRYPTCPRTGFARRLDEVQVYDRALTAAEVATLHAPGATTPPVIGSPGTIGPPGGPVFPPAPPAPAPPRPAATFNALGRLSALQPVVLDAGRTANADRLRWDLTGDGRTDVTCPGSQPALRLTTTAATARTVTLTAVGPGGTSSAAARVAGGGPTLGRRVASSIRDSAVCAPNANQLLGPPQRTSCVSQTVVFGLVEAAGCFTRVQDERGIPGPEARTIRRYYDNPEYPAWVVAACAKARTDAQRKACEDAKRPFRDLDFYVSSGPVKLNGITFTPSGSGSLVVFPSLNRVISQGASVRWGGMAVRNPGAINFSPRSNSGTLGKRGSGVSGQFHLFNFKAPKGFDGIAGFELEGEVTLSLRGVNGERVSEGRLRLRMPSPFRALGGPAPSGEAAALASNRGNPTFGSLAINVPEALLGPVRLSDLSFRYERNGGIDGDRNPGTSCNRNEWKARGDIFLSGGRERSAGLKLTPPPPQNGLGFCDGRFKHFGGDLRFGAARPQIFPGVFLDSIGFNIQLSPTALRGRGVLSVGDLADVDGELQMIFASPDAPFQLGRYRLTSTTISAGGGVGVRAPVIGRIPLANGSLTYSAPDFVGFSGEARVIVPGIAIFGRLGGAARLGRALFSLNGGATACLGGVRGGVCFGGDAWVTSIGTVACLNIGPLHPGAGLRWSGRLEIWPFDGCKPSPYWVTVTNSRANQAVRTFRVARGERIKFVKLAGRDGAPKVRVTGPGTNVATGDELVTSARNVQVIRSEEARATFVGLEGSPGTYRVETLPGSVPIASMAASRPGYDTDFSARVTGRGRARTLVYDARRRGGQRVTFVEVGRNVFRPLKTVTGGRGRLRFRPALGPAGRRTIVAVATVNGVPIPNQTLARFSAAGVPRTGRPRLVSVKRRGRALAIRWSRVTGARRYGVVVELRNGTERQLVAGPRRRALRVRGVDLTQGGTVRVSAQGVLNGFGRPRTARFPRLRRPQSAFVTQHENPRKRRGR